MLVLPTESLTALFFQIKTECTVENRCCITIPNISGFILTVKSSHRVIIISEKMEGKLFFMFTSNRPGNTWLKFQQGRSELDFRKFF